ncbi:MAG: glycosyltransferase family 4 protein [Thermoplasmata archaeon]|nr:MAG: glycosyltransferase family 4 protein [Thermoplasmata archaeon]
MIPVVCLRYYPALGGVETRALEVTNRLAKSFDLNVVTSDLKMERPFQRLSETEQLTEYKGVPIKRLESKKFLPVEGYGVKIKGLAEALSGSEMIHVHTYGAHHADKAAKIAKKLKVPSILTTHLHPASHSHHKMLRTIYDSIIGKKTLKRYTHIITITEIEKDYMAKRFGIPKKKMTAIPNGIDLLKFHDLGYEREKNSLLFVGRLSPVKRLDMLIKALSIVKKQIPDVKLKIIGRDWGEKAKLVELIKGLNLKENVEFLKEVPFEKLVEHYNRAKVFVLTSKYEAFGITIMEAIGCGTPVVVSSVGGIPEVVGDAGILCQENEQSVAKAIIELLRDEKKYNKLKKNTKTRRELFDWDIIADRVKTIYDKTLSSR